MKNNLLTNSSTTLGLYFVNIIITLIMSPILVHTLGNRDYGAWDVVISIVGYLGILDLGISPAIVSRIAKASATDDSEQINKILSTALCALLGVGATVLTCMVGLSFFSHSILNVNKGDIPHLSLLFILLGANLGVQFSGTAFVAYLMGLMQYSFINGLRIIFAILQACLAYYLLGRFPGNGLLCLAFMLLSTNILQYSVMAIRVLRMAHPTASLFRSDRATLKDLLAFGVNSMLLMAADRIQRSCVPLVLTHTVGLDKVVFFVLPNRLVDHARNSAAAIATPLAPYYGYLEGKGNDEDKRKKWLDLSKWLQFFCLGSGIVTLALGVDFLRVWMGPFYAENGKWVLYLMGIDFLVEGISPNASRYLIGTGKHKLPARIQAALSVPTLLLVVIGSKSMGISGAAGALLLANSITYISFWVIACKELQIPIRTYISSTVVPLFFPLIIATSTLLGIKTLSPTTSYVTIAGMAISTGIVYMAAGWFFAMTPSEKNFVNMGISRMLRRPL